MHSDPISDMLTRIRNASGVRKAEVVLPYSKFKKALAEVLLKEGFIAAVEEGKGLHRTLRINLKYSGDGAEAISGIKRVSRPGQRIYLPAHAIPRTNSGWGITIVSTSQGLMTDKQTRKNKVGGEVVCQVW